MRAVLVLCDDLHAQLDDVFWLVHFDDARIVFGQPRAQLPLGTPDYRANFPERIVEIEGNRANAVHVLLAVPQ